jgi:beta-lactamase class A
MHSSDRLPRLRAGMLGRGAAGGVKLLMAAVAMASVMVVLSLTHVSAQNHLTPIPTALPFQQLAAADDRPAPDPSPSPSPTPPPPPRSFKSLNDYVSALEAESGGQVAVALAELGGAQAGAWSYSGDQRFEAASTYKLPLLMAEAQGIASGAVGAADRLCFQSSDYEDGWFEDYSSGDCFTRQALALRVGRESDNTAAHILVRYLGGTSAINAYATAHGATESSFWSPNTTTASDLAALWQDEAEGKAGGGAAQALLLNWLTNTQYESGIPAGVPAGTVVAHKVGEVDSVVGDAALVANGPKGAYVLVVLTDGVGGDAAWSLIAGISNQAWHLEAARQG